MRNEILFGGQNYNSLKKRDIVEENTSLVPDSDEKHSDTTQQNIQMLKDQLDLQ